MSTVVEVNHLTKQFGQVNALDDVSFTIEGGKIYGLLGRNGAGKTTIMHILTAQGFATSGEVKVFGEIPFENAQVLNQVCFIKESQKYPTYYHVEDVFAQAAALFPHWSQPFAEQLINEFHLPLKRPVKALSRGMLSSVGIIVGLASRAPLTIFDEPYLGLDAVARTLFYDHLLQDYAEHPRTVLLSTHLIDEVSRLLEHVLVIDQGKIILNEDADMLRGRAFAVVGPTAKVEAYVSGHEVIKREPLGGMTSATIMGNGTELDRQQVAALGLEVAPVSLQQLIVQLTSARKEMV